MSRLALACEAVYQALLVEESAANRSRIQRALKLLKAAKAAKEEP